MYDHMRRVGWVRLGHRRDLLRELVSRDIKLRYQRSVIGIAWSLVNPLAQLLVFSLVFGRVLNRGVPDYPAFVFTGILVWTWFQTSLTLGVTAITDNRELVRRPGFATAILPWVTVTTHLVHFLLALPVLIVFLLLSGHGLGAAVLALPVLVAIQFVITLGLIYVAATFQVPFRDTQHILGLVLLLLFYLSPVIYSDEIVTGHYRRLYRLNPLVHLLDAYRAVLLEGTLPNLRAVLALALLAVGLVVAGHLAFRSAADRFAEEV